jgi:hypothetical protein
LDKGLQHKQGLEYQILGYQMHFSFFLSFFLSFFRGKVDLHISKRSKGKIEGKTKSVSRGVQKRRKDTALVAREREWWGPLLYDANEKAFFYPLRDATFDVWTKESAFANLETAAARAFLLSRGYA